VRVRVRGVVQGVGFRPFVYRLATGVGLTGFVRNDTSGVVAEVEGDPAAIADFTARIEAEAPPIATVRSVTTEEILPRHEQGFRIPESERGADEGTLIPPDVATCAACARELLDPGDRRHGYPFINCTDCGPRYTIVDGIPYDRSSTTMRGFEMCAACRAEYDDPQSRRFHAQPNACADCGPRVRLVDACGARRACADPIHETIGLLEQGSIVAVKGLGGFHLACDATSEDPVTRLRERKRRPHKPFAVMARDVGAVERLALVSPLERQLLEGWRRPIVLLSAREQGCPLAHGVCQTSRWVGAMLPYTPLHHLLMQGSYAALVMTSGNLSDEPIAYEDEVAVARLGRIADFFLVHDRPILVPADDSVARQMGDRPALMRRSRGFVPEPVLLPRPGPPVLAVGGDLKNTCCVTRGELAFPSQYIGDLASPEAADLLSRTVEHLQGLLAVEPALVVHDLHPDYASTRFAQTRTSARLLAIQHHHAHALSCLADNSIEAPALAIVLDGTGYGTDGRIWGGEVLRVDGLECQRLAHLAYLPLPGGDRATREPWRVALSALMSAYGEDVLTSLADLPPFDAADPEMIDGVVALAARPGASPLTSSAGRMFDAVASLLGLRHVTSYEAQAALELERAAEAAQGSCIFAYELHDPGNDSEPVLIDLAPTVRGIVREVRSGIPLGDIARGFHEILATALVDVTAQFRDRTGIAQVALSGGVMQNRLLHDLLERGLTARGMRVLCHHQVSPNDGGLALGQAWAGVLARGQAPTS